MRKQSGPINENAITAINLYIECCNAKKVPIFQYRVPDIEKWNTKNKRYGGKIIYSAYILLAQLMSPDLLIMMQEIKKGESPILINKKTVDHLAIALARANAKREDMFLV